MIRQLKKMIDELQKISELKWDFLAYHIKKINIRTTMDKEVGNTLVESFWKNTCQYPSKILRNVGVLT